MIMEQMSVFSSSLGGEGWGEGEMTRYVHGLGVDEPLAMERGGNVYYYHADGLGSIVALTDATGKTAQAYEYDAFGRLHDRMNAIRQPYAFTGREWDKEIGLYYYRARYYDAETGRFTTKDPIGFRGGMNLYNYVGANPVNRRDPWGLEGIEDYDAAYREFLRETKLMWGSISNITGGPVCFDYADMLREYFAKNVKSESCQVSENIQGPYFVWVHANVKVQCGDVSTIFDPWWRYWRTWDWRLGGIF